jgi:hypothetical protein
MAKDKDQREIRTDNPSAEERVEISSILAGGEVTQGGGCGGSCVADSGTLGPLRPKAIPTPQIRTINPSWLT